MRLNVSNIGAILLIGAVASGCTQITGERSEAGNPFSGTQMNVYMSEPHQYNYSYDYRPPNEDEDEDAAEQIGFRAEPGTW